MAEIICKGNFIGKCQSYPFKCVKCKHLLLPEIFDDHFERRKDILGTE